jgi:hypothetical protein
VIVQRLLAYSGSSSLAVFQPVLVGQFAPSDLIRPSSPIQSLGVLAVACFVISILVDIGHDD